MNNDYINITYINGAILGICKISHIPNSKKTSYQLSEVDQEYFNNIRNTRRKNEWLATRILLNHILGANHQIYYTQEGKPYLKENLYHLSISHSKEYATILLSPNKEVALDIESTKRRISHIKEKFVNSKENPTNDLDLFKIWCAKEAVFKLLDHPSVDLLKETIVDLKKEQIVFLRTNEIFQLHFQNIENELICYIIR